MLQSSAYRTNRCPRRSSSRSSSSSTRLLSKGESGPPCRVPSTLGLTSPFSRKLQVTPNHKVRLEHGDKLGVGDEIRNVATYKTAPWNRTKLKLQSLRGCDAIER